MVPIRVVLQSGVESVQRRIRLRERNVEHLRVYHPTVVPGLLQTEAYVRLVAQAGGLDDVQTGHLVEERLRRQRDSATRRCTILLPEGCVMQGVPDAETMAEQCRSIAHAAAGHPSWTVGVIPRLVPVGSPANITMNAFDIYDDREVFLGTTAGNALVGDPFTVTDHLRRFADLERLALFGAQARDLLADIAADYGRHRPA